MTDGVGQPAAPTVLLLHGWALSADFLYPLGAALSAHARVVALDLPGHGANRDRHWPSAEAYMAEQLDRVGPAYVVGWSLGGLYALVGALARPSLVRGIGLMASNPRFVADGDWPGVAPEVLERFATDLAVSPAATVQRFIDLEVLGVSLADDPRSAWRQRALQAAPPNPEGLAQGLALLRDFDARPVIRALDVPLVAIGGRRDRMVPPAAVLASAGLARRGQAHVLSGAGHAPFIQQPEAVVQALYAGLVQHPTR